MKCIEYKITMIFVAKSGGVLSDDLIHLAETLLSVVNGPYKVWILNSSTLLKYVDVQIERPHKQIACIFPLFIHLFISQYEDLDMDMITDACLWLWNKCKAIFQKYQTGASDNPKYLQKMNNPGKVYTFICKLQRRN